MKSIEKQRSGSIGDRRVFDVLRDRISSHELGPGSALRESNLVSEFGVSRARVRNIFGMLHERGLIERVPNVGATVARLDLKTALELFDIREVNEGLCARLATEKNRPDIWAGLLTRFEGEVSQSIKSGDLNAYVDALDETWQLMLQTAANPILSDTLLRIQDRTKILIRRIVVLPGRIDHGLAETKRIMKAMCRGDADEAEKLKRENIRSARAWLERYESFLW